MELQSEHTRFLRIRMGFHSPRKEGSSARAGLVGEFRQEEDQMSLIDRG